MFAYAKIFQKRFGIWVLFMMLLNITLTPSAMGASLYAILVGDTSANIGAGIQRDLKKMKGLVARIVQNTGLELQSPQVLSGSDVNRDAVVSAIQSLSPDPDDVILFYSSSHGISSYGMWPLIVFSSGGSLEFSWIVQELQSKGARLVVGITDSCNNPVQGTPSDSGKTFVPRRVSPDDYERLILGYKGSVFASSSRTGEVSCINSQIGSAFTNNFLTLFQKALSSGDWKAVKSSGIPCRSSSPDQLEQHPQYAINVTKVEIGDTEDTEKPDDCSINAVAVDESKTPKDVFCINDSLDVRLTNSCRGAKYVSVVNSDTRGESWVVYSGWLKPGTHTLASMLHIDEFSVGGPAGTETIQVKVHEGEIPGSRISFEVRNCRNSW